MHIIELIAYLINELQITYIKLSIICKLCTWKKKNTEISKNTETFRFNLVHASVQVGFCTTIFKWIIKKKKKLN